MSSNAPLYKVHSVQWAEGTSRVTLCCRLCWLHPDAHRSVFVFTESILCCFLLWPWNCDLVTWVHKNYMLVMNLRITQSEILLEKKQKQNVYLTGISKAMLRSQWGETWQCSWSEFTAGTMCVHTELCSPFNRHFPSIPNIDWWWCIYRKLSGSSK